VAVGLERLTTARAIDAQYYHRAGTYRRIQPETVELEAERSDASVSSRQLA
jgi:hypothetical protein